MKPFRVLAIDDNEGILEDYRKVLTSSQPDHEQSEIEELLFGARKSERDYHSEVDLVCATQGEEGLAHVNHALSQGTPFHLAFVDMRMPPGWDGLKTIKELRAADPEIFVVLCTAYSDYSLQTLNKELGNQANFLILRKPFQPEEIQQLVTSVAARRTLSERSSYFDQLTGLHTRRGFLDVIDNDIEPNLVANAKRRMATFEINHIGPGSSNFAEAEVISLLTSLGHEFSRIAQDYGMLVARVDEDQFALFDTADDEAKFQQVVRQLSHERSFTASHDSRKLDYSISVGWTQCDEAKDSYELLKECEWALRESTRQGRGRPEKFQPEIVDAAVRTRTFEQDLTRALDRHEFKLFFQPIVDLRSMEIVGAEALIRWLRNGRTVASPDEFIPVAEEMGQINLIGDWVFEESVRALERLHHTTGNHDLYMSINVSNAQLDDVSFCRRIVNIAEAYFIKPSRIAIEVTESCAAAQPEATHARLQRLRDFGFHVFIDDFGTGYSSIAKLAAMPCDTVKLDKEFLERITIDEAPKLVVHGTIRLIESLNKQIVAEGVETKEHLRILQEMGCHLAQGYLISKPLPLDDLIAFFRKADFTEYMRLDAA